MVLWVSVDLRLAQAAKCVGDACDAHDARVHHNEHQKDCAGPHSPLVSNLVCISMKNAARHSLFGIRCGGRVHPMPLQWKISLTRI